MFYWRSALAALTCSLICYYFVGETMTAKLARFDFEIFGRVQGVFFRKCTVDEAKRLGLRGWCQNTPEGTVRGQAEGPLDGLESMKRWLREAGSPASQIERATFTNEMPIDKYQFEDFTVIKKKK